MPISNIDRSSLIQTALQARHQSALEELDKLIHDMKDVPINYNHYYTDNVHKKRQDRVKAQIQEHIPSALTNASTSRCSAGDHYGYIDISQEITKIVRNWAKKVTPNMESLSCEEALDCLLAIYKVRRNFSLLLCYLQMALGSLQGGADRLRNRFSKRLSSPTSPRR
jgi:hypothetical protein